MHKMWNWLLEGPYCPRFTHVQVRKLELERTQHSMLLESLQQRHQADLELIEDAHRYLLSPVLGAARAHVQISLGPRIMSVCSVRPSRWVFC